MFGFFRKKEEEQQPKLHYDPTNMNIRDIRLGWMFQFEDKMWEVIEEYEYDWGNERFSYGFMVQSQEGEQLFLDIEEERGLVCTFYEAMNFYEIPDAAAIADAIVDEDSRPPRELLAKGIKFFRMGEKAGFFRNILDKDSREFMMWDFWDQPQEHRLKLERWGEDTFEVYIGWIVYENDFSGFLPKQQDNT